MLSFCHVSADLVLKNFSARECSKSALVLIFSAGTKFTGLVTILAREMRFKFFSSRPTFGDVASAAGHDIGARNAIKFF